MKQTPVNRALPICSGFTAVTVFNLRLPMSFRLLVRGYVSDQTGEGFGSDVWI
jgi:hypothetical protein